jgi:hypothetical protein
MPTNIARVGILSPVTEVGMKDRRWEVERLPDLANELAKLGVDVIMPATPPAI